MSSPYEFDFAMFTWRISEIWLHKLSLIVTPKNGSNYFEKKNITKSEENI